MNRWLKAGFLAALLVAAEHSAAGTMSTPRFAFHIGGQVPMDTVLRDGHGRPRPLNAQLAGHPVLLLLGYYRCHQLCDTTIGDLARGLSESGLEVGRDVDVAMLSIDPREQARDALGKRAEWQQRYPAAHLERWVFLTGTSEAIDPVAASVGFEYTYVPRLDRYAHPAGVVVLTRVGRIATYILGVRFEPGVLTADVRAAADGQAGGAPIEGPLLRCFDGLMQSSNAMTALWWMRGMAILMLLVLAAVLLRWRRRALHG
jgi:protein SCO1/2